jgi:hypothetical protein
VDDGALRPPVARPFVEPPGSNEISVAHEIGHILAHQSDYVRLCGIGTYIAARLARLLLPAIEASEVDFGRSCRGRLGDNSRFN